MGQRIRWDGNERHALALWLAANPMPEANATAKLHAAQAAVLAAPRHRVFQSAFIAEEALKHIVTGATRTELRTPPPDRVLPLQQLTALPAAQQELTLADFLRMHSMLKPGKYTVNVV